MFGCSRFAAILASRMNRERNASLSESSSDMIFRATLRPSLASMAMKTVLMPPRPSSDSIV
jgi:hypothetical protein